MYTHIIFVVCHFYFLFFFTFFPPKCQNKLLLKFLSYLRKTKNFVFLSYVSVTWCQESRIATLAKTLVCKRYDNECTLTLRQQTHKYSTLSLFLISQRVRCHLVFLYCIYLKAHGRSDGNHPAEIPWNAKIMGSRLISVPVFGLHKSQTCLTKH